MYLSLHSYNVFRHEMGMDYAHVPFWQLKDAQTTPADLAPLRKGITEVKWISGQYKFFLGWSV
jgi:hypothetical protein